MMLCHCTLAGTQACKNCSRYKEYFGEQINNTSNFRPKGRWIDKGDYAECSICGGYSGVQYDGVQRIPLKTKYCPYCGADMRGEQ